MSTIRKPARLRLVSPGPAPTCAATIAQLEHLLDEARAGRIVGLAVVATSRQRSYSVEATGLMRDDPTFARGAVAALDDELRELVREDAFRNPAIVAGFGPGRHDGEIG